MTITLTEREAWGTRVVLMKLIRVILIRPDLMLTAVGTVHIEASALAGRIKIRCC